MKKHNKISFGIIGCSSVAKRNFIPAIRSSNYASLDFIGSRELAKAQEWAKKNNCNSFGNYDEVLESDVDAVYISLPVGLHEEWSIKAANSGKHIICEKSSTTSFNSAKKIIKHCNKNNIEILEGFSFRFHPQHRFVIEQITKNQLGKLYNFYGAFGYPAPNLENIRWNKNLGGGILNDATCYPICASRMILQSEPVEVIANFEYDKKTNIDISNNVILLYSKNRYANIITGFDHYFQSTYSIWGSKAMLNTKRAYAVPNQFRTSIYLHKNDKVIETVIPSVDQFQIMIDHFSKTISHIEHSFFNYEKDFLNQAKVLEAIRKSNKEKRRIFMNEII